MTAAELREAAALMRSRAEAANEGPWLVGKHWTDTYRVGQLYENGSFAVAADLVKPDAAHIASWHPAVALAVADWLEAESHAPETEHEGGAYTTGGPSLMALRVARAYLGTAS